MNDKWKESKRMNIQADVGVKSTCDIVIARLIGNSGIKAVKFCNTFSEAKKALGLSVMTIQENHIDYAFAYENRKGLVYGDREKFDELKSKIKRANLAERERKG